MAEVKIEDTKVDEIIRLLEVLKETTVSQKIYDQTKAMLDHVSLRRGVSGSTFTWTSMG